MEDYDYTVILKEYPGYIICPDGKIFSKKIEKYLSLQKSGGYYNIRLYNKEGKRITIRSHILTAKAFIKNPNNLPEVNHKDRNGLNNDISNLEWITKSGNQKHVIETGKNFYTRSVNQYTPDKEFIKKYKGIKAAAEKLYGDKSNENNKKEIRNISNSIGRVCRGIRETYKGFIWKYADKKEYEPIKGEIWKEIPKHPEYQASTKGRLWSDKTNKLFKLSIRKDGYVKCELDRNKYYLHILIAKTFLGEAPEDMINPDVNHKDGKKSNNKLSNLEWLDHNLNCQHAHDTGLNSSSKSVVQYSLKGEKIAEFKSVTSAAKSVNVHKSCIAEACKLNGRNSTSKGFIWRYQDDPFDFKETNGHKKSVIQYSLKGKEIKTWESIKEATIELNIKGTTISAVCKGNKNYKTAGGFQWRYEGSEIPVISLARKVGQYNEDDELLAKFKNVTEASKATDINSSHIYSVCKEKRSRAGGYVWKYL